ncbi:MAG: hypothetical protein A4E35_01091 [Methanoregula sp. PtaU1.Bin051]|nr:MAG: hypothetical protein A4E35_01091 [Methanoregula sp. PtaU1.Bin051]
MPAGLLIPALCAPALLCLNGRFSAVTGIAKTLQESIGMKFKSTLPVKKDKPASTEAGTQTITGMYSGIITTLSEPSWKGIGAFGAVSAMAIITGSAVLFIDLPLPLMTVLGIISLAALTLSVSVIQRRRTKGAWLPENAGPPIPGISSLIQKTETAGPCAPSAPELPEGTARLLPYLPNDPSPSVISQYWVQEPFSYVKVARAGTEGFKYIVVEPPITKKEKTILQETYARLRDFIVYDATERDQDPKFKPELIRKIMRQFDPDLTDEQLLIMDYYLKRDLSGYGPLETIMLDPDIEDISCNGYELPVFVFDRSFGSLPTSIAFGRDEINQFVLKLAQKANKQVSLSNPLVDATLPDGARVQITYSDVVSTKGSSFTIRKFRAEPMTPLDLIRYGTYNAETLAFLWLAIEHRKSLLVVGGTASGKTSTMNAVSLFIPQNAKIVSLEDTREIQLPHKNWLPTQTRELNVTGIKGDIDLFSLLKACMRQRPEYIIVGEVRGAEAQTLFQAMNTGHATLSTIHAGSVHEAINRLTHDPINVPSVMFTALDVVVVQSIYTAGKIRIRRCLSIHEIEVNAKGEIIPVLLYEWDVRTDTFRKVAEKSRVLDEIAFVRGWSPEELEQQVKKREEFFAWALEVQPPDIRDLANAIHDLGE